MNGIRDEQQYEVCQYGCETILYTIISTIGLLLIGVFTGFLQETIVIISVFYLCQSNGGGYHASTHIKCFITMAVGLAFSLSIIRICNYHSPYLVALIISSIILIKHPLCLHSNKRYLEIAGQQLTMKSRIVSISIIALTVVNYIVGYHRIGRAGCVALLVSALSRAIAYNKIQIESNEQDEQIINVHIG